MMYGKVQWLNLFMLALEFQGLKFVWWWVTYKRVVRGRDGVEIKSMIDLVLVKRDMDMLRYVQDVRVVKVMGRGLSYHYVVLVKVRLV